MLPTVRKCITDKTPPLLKEWGVNWTTIQNVDLKKKHKFPCQWRTLYNIVKKGIHPCIRIETALLVHLKVKHNVKDNIVTLENPSEYE